MFSTLAILLPIFGLIFAGYACRRFNVLGPTAASELNRFVVWLALPAVLFKTLAHATWQTLYHPGFIAAFCLACAVVFVAVLVVRLVTGQRLADASIESIAASYPNVAYVGLPLCMLVFGPSSLTFVMIVTIIVVCVLFGCAVVLIEMALQAERRPHWLMLKVLNQLMRNPLVVAPLAGALVCALHLPVPKAAEEFLDLLGDAASPCALVSLGLFLAERRSQAKVHHDVWWLTGVRLFVQPALTWFLAVYVFSLPLLLVKIAVLCAALPTGTGPYMLAEYYRREAHITSHMILLSTVGSLVTLSLLLPYIQHP